MSFFDPPQDPLPPGFPLAATDSSGQAIVEGSRVRIGVMPQWLIHDLPAEDVARLRAVEGRVLPVLEIDGFGYLWFGDHDPWFCLMPTEVTLDSESVPAGKATDH
ncbi:hypothetical protein [Lysobacter sp. CA199]|uniref:hypothetical protein n=1 Tax=Lysobacter sp. CA199 TaxID=3455608 RepID=UPI003F8D0DDE